MVWGLAGQERNARHRREASADRSGGRDKVEAWFNRHGYKAVFFGRMIPIFRSLISIPAGIERMPVAKFLLLTSACSLIWNAIFVLAGFYLGENWHSWNSTRASSKRSSSSSSLSPCSTGSPPGSARSGTAGVSIPAAEPVLTRLPLQVPRRPAVQRLSLVHPFRSARRLSRCRRCAQRSFNRLHARPVRRLLPALLPASAARAAVRRDWPYPARHLRRGPGGAPPASPVRAQPNPQRPVQLRPKSAPS